MPKRRTSAKRARHSKKHPKPVSAKKPRHSAKHPKSAKRPLTAWNLYVKKHSAEIKKQYPNLNFGERAKMIGNMWGTYSNK